MYKQRIWTAWGHAAHREWAHFPLDRRRDLIVHEPRATRNKGGKFDDEKQQRREDHYKPGAIHGTIIGAIGYVGEKKTCPFRASWREKKGTKGTCFVQQRVLIPGEALSTEKGKSALQRPLEGFISF